MLISFLLGTVFGAVLFFMARIATIKLETIVERYSASGRLLPSKPQVVQPPKETDEQMMQELQKQLNGE